MLMTGKSAQQWIDELELTRHPEGGWFRRVYESELTVDGIRPAMTSIYYLLEGGDFSALHRLKQDEQWHFYAGDPLILHIVAPDGEASTITLGPEGPFQTTVKAGHLFGATNDGAYALVGCTVAPGFDYADFEMPSRAALLEAFPQHEMLIRRLTRA
jgi:predicted cupin superfamily sugar epimerase